MQPKHLGTTLAVAGLSLAAAACSSSPSTSSSASAQHASMTATVGSGCSTIPKSGTGSLSGMATDPVATAAAHNPQLANLTHAVDLASLSGTLNSAKYVTVFAPNNDAFLAMEKQLGGADVQKLMSSKTDLTDVLEYHVVNGDITPTDLASGKALTSWLGQPLHPSKSGSTYMINNAQVVCGNIKTKNATVYVINMVLIP
ncbi:MAG TPA: fasciclin domain-containing protein [Streptosporangiaceae bacterium]|nr:fasciclin domain-containing protein [Streptosporangiaceae bacterium]